VELGNQNGEGQPLAVVTPDDDMGGFEYRMKALSSSRTGGMEKRRTGGSVTFKVGSEKKDRRGEISGQIKGGPGDILLGKTTSTFCKSEKIGGGG